MPKDTTRFVSSTMGSRRSRVQPIPDFRKLHSQWQDKMDHKKKLNAKPTVPEEFDLTKSGKKLSKVDAHSRQEKLSKLPTANPGALKELQTNVRILTETVDSAAETPLNNCDFECDEKALESILLNTGITMVPPVSSTSVDQSAKKKTCNFTTGASSPAAYSFRSQGCWVKDRASIYDKWVPAGIQATLNSVTRSAVKGAPAARVPLRNGDAPMTALNQANATYSNCIAGRTRSRFDSHFTAQTPIVDEPIAAAESNTKSCKRTAGLKETLLRIPRSRSTSKPRVARLVVDENSSMKTSTPRAETRSLSKKNAEVNVVRVIQFDETDAAKQNSTEKHQSKSSSRRSKRRSVTAEGCRRPQFDMVYQDLDPEAQASPLSPWRDNIMSSPNIRSPLSVVSHPLNKASTVNHLDTLRSREDKLFSTKQAVAELMVMKRAVNKENNKVLPPVLRHKSELPQSRVAFVDVNTQPVLSAVDLYHQRNAAHKAIEVHEASPEEDDDKENTKVVELEHTGQVMESVNQLEKQARNLRRRSQMTCDVDEQARILRDIQAIKKRLHELELARQQQSKAKSKGFMPGKEEDFLSQPLNLKISKASSNVPSTLTEDVILDEPLNLKVSSVSDVVEEFRTKDGRKILEDITLRVVGDILENECFEVPESPEPCLESHRSDVVEDDVEPLDLCIAKRSMERQSSVKGIQEYLASLELSTISESIDSPITKSVNKSLFGGCLCETASPDVSSEFVGYRTYCPLLGDEEVSVRCGDPVALMLCDGDDQHFCPIINDTEK